MMGPSARITRIRQETPTIKSFVLDVAAEGFSFLPGQWIDLLIARPGQDMLVGGFTLVSSPTHPRSIELAIKRSGWGRAAAYMHDYAQVGDTFHLLGPGGDFCFQDGMSDSLVLVAGGVGINPLMSMVRYIDSAALKVQVDLFYSASSPSELLFYDELRAIEARNPLIRCLFTVTRPGEEPWEGRVGRIDREMLSEARGGGQALYYLCGPSGMPRAIAAVLNDMGVPWSAIRFEEWW